jgi:hypothetical protein
MDVVNFIRTVGIDFLLMIFVGVLLVAGVSWLVWRVSPRIGKILVLVILLISGTFLVAKSVSPAGKYTIGGCRGPGRAWFGITDDYYEFSGGVFYEVVDGHRRRLGSYRKKDGHWFVEGDASGPFAEQGLRFSVLGFCTVLPAFGDSPGGPTTFNRRRIIPFTRPSWMPEWLE